jgi:Cdc6-like AAA superfamily ATPase
LNRNQIYVTGKLDALNSAIFDSDAVPEEQRKECHPGTRIEILGRIGDWANNTEGHRILWLQGKAGTGKSTISQTVAGQIAKSSHCGASFFFLRSAGERSNAARLFTTITSQLVEQLPSMSRHVRNAIEANPRITEKTKNEQFNKLTLEPLEKIDNESTNVSRTIVVVIDALDECDGESSIREIIGLLPAAK